TSSIPAYMLVTHHTIPQFQCAVWIILLSILGVFFAFPLKKRFINDEQLPFPEGYAAAVVLEGLHDDVGGADGRESQGVFKAKLLGAAAGLTALVELMRSEKVMGALRVPFLKLPDYWD